MPEITGPYGWVCGMRLWRVAMPFDSQVIHIHFTPASSGRMLCPRFFPQTERLTVSPNILCRHGYGHQDAFRKF